jgi:dTDP-4-dehydrorhamnose 3,5-epimerase
VEFPRFPDYVVGKGLVVRARIDKAREPRDHPPLEVGMSELEGVVLTRLTPHRDDRGVFTEAFRAMWPTGVAPIQWNIVTNRPNILRGVHVHIRHTDYLTCVLGELLVGLKDIRPESPTHGRVAMHLLREDEPAALTIPTGVAHGFYSRGHSKQLYAVSEYWNTADELGCRWDDPGLSIDWPASAPTISERDDQAGSYERMVAEYLEGAAALARTPEHVIS